MDRSSGALETQIDSSVIDGHRQPMNNVTCPPLWLPPRAAASVVRRRLRPTLATVPFHQRCARARRQHASTGAVCGTDGRHQALRRIARGKRNGAGRGRRSSQRRPARDLAAASGSGRRHPPPPPASRNRRNSVPTPASSIAALAVSGSGLPPQTLGGAPRWSHSNFSGKPRRAPPATFARLNRRDHASVLGTDHRPRTSCRHVLHTSWPPESQGLAPTI